MMMFGQTRIFFVDGARRPASGSAVDGASTVPDAALVTAFTGIFVSIAAAFSRLVHLDATERGNIVCIRGSVARRDDPAQEGPDSSAAVPDAGDFPVFNRLDRHAVLLFVTMAED